MSSRTSFPASLAATLRANRVDLWIIGFITAYSLFSEWVAERNGTDLPLFQFDTPAWLYGAIALGLCAPLAVLFLTNRDPAARNEAASLYILRAVLFASFSFFITAFSQLKAVLYRYIPYDLDAELTALDKWLHFGADPWVVYWPFLEVLDFEGGSFFYHVVWPLPVIFGAGLLIFLDRNVARRRRVMITHLFIWMFLGNVCALFGYTVGPVFWNELIPADPDRFAALEAAQAASGFHDTAFGFSVDYLLLQRTTGDAMASAGIAAFPSIHVAMAVLTALYFCSLSRWFIAPMIAYVFIIQIFSVLCGLHYAVDGYFSLILVPAFWVWLGRRPAWLSNRATGD